MSDSRKYAKPDFSVFEQQDLSAWKNRIAKELKGKPYEEVMHYADGTEAANHKQNTQPAADLVRPQYADWAIQARFVLSGDLEALNKQLLRQLVDGVEALIIKVPYADSFISAPARDYTAAIATLMEGVIPSYIQISFDAGYQAPYVLQAYTTWLQQKGYAAKGLAGTFMVDPHAMAAWAGEWTAFDTTAFAKELYQALPDYVLCTANAYLYNACGASAEQELAVGLMSLLDTAVPNARGEIGIRLASSSALLPELAKIRGVHTLWQRTVARYKPEWADTTLSVAVSTSLWNQAVTDPHNNLIRITLQAIAAVHAGALQLEVQPYDILNEEPAEFSYRMSKNIQLLLKEESYMNRIADPAGGSYAIENITAAIIDVAEELITDSMSKGSLRQQLEQGIWQEAINANKAKILAQFQQGEVVQVGVNKYQTAEQVVSPQAPKLSGSPAFPTISPLRLG